jgi:hypothetical protein
VNGACPVVRDAVSHAIEELPAIGSRFRWEIRDLPKQRKPHKWPVPGKTVTSARLRDHCAFRTSCWRRRTLAVKAEINTKQDLGSSKQIGQATELRLPIAKEKQTSGRSALQSSGTTQNKRSQNQSATPGRSTETTANNLGPVTGAQETNELKDILCRNEKTSPMKSKKNSNHVLAVTSKYVPDYMPVEGENIIPFNFVLTMVGHECMDSPQFILDQLGLSLDENTGDEGAVIATRITDVTRTTPVDLPVIDIEVDIIANLSSQTGESGLVKKMDDVIGALILKEYEVQHQRRYLRRAIQHGQNPEDETFAGFEDYEVEA